MTSPLLNRVTPKDTIETWRQKTNEIVDRLKDLYPHVDNNLYVENDAFIKGHLTVDGQLHVKANLIVDGTTTTINTTELNIEDNTILLNSNLTGTPPNVLESGIEVNRGSSDNKRFYWDEATLKWIIEGDLDVTGDINNSSFQWVLDPNTNHISNLNSGNVGIGTDDPQALLEVKNTTTNADIRVNGVNGGLSGVYFGDQADTVRGAIEFDSTENTLSLRGYNNEQRLTIDSSGKVGIGTSTPSRNLHVMDLTNDGSGGVKVSSYLPVIELQDMSSGGGSSKIQQDQSFMKIGPTTSNTNLVFNTEDTERMRIDKDGNVGINTTSPLRKLHVRYEQDLPQPASSAISTSTSAVISGRDGGLELLSTDDNTNVANFIGLGRYSQTDGSLIHKFGIVHRANTGSEGTNSGKSLGFTYGGSANSYGNNELLTILAGGSVGIGNTDPGARLSVTRSNKSIELDFISPWNRILSFDRITNAEVPLKVRGSKFTIDTNNTEQFRINDDGNVSIGGNTTPAEKLEVSGAIKLGTTSNNNSGTIRYNTTTNDFEGNTDGTSGGWTSLTNANANLWSAGTSSGDIHYSSGNVGIGTNNPASPLHVVGELNAGNNAKRVRINSTSTHGIIEFNSDTSGLVRSNTGDLRFQTNGANDRLTIGSTGKVEIKTDSTNTAGFSGTSGLDDMVIRGSENVGLMIVSKATSLTSSSSAATINFACDVSAGGTIVGFEDIQHGFIKTVIDTNSENTSMHLGLKGNEYLSILDCQGGVSVAILDGQVTAPNAIAIGAGGTSGASNSLPLSWTYTNSSSQTMTVGSRNSILIGDTNYSSGMYAYALGGYNQPTGYQSISLGHFNKSLGERSICIGSYCESGGELTPNSNSSLGYDHNGDYAISMGYKMNTRGENSFGISLNQPSIPHELTQDNTMAIMGGNVGIGTVTPSEKLVVDGNITATGTIQSISDITLKENLEIIENPIEKIKEINGYTYNMIGKEDRHAGLIAQEVEKVLPEVVSENSDGIKSLAYGNIVALLVETVKEQQKQIDELKKLISDK